MPHVLNKKKFLIFPFSFLILTLAFSSFTHAWFRPVPPRPPDLPPKPSKIVICSHIIRQMNKTKNQRIKNQYQKLLRRYKECRVFGSLTKIFQSDSTNQNLITQMMERNLISSEISKTFSEEEFARAESESANAYGEILSIQIDPQIHIENDWMETYITIKTEKETTRYLTVFHLENGDWKLFGTNALD